MRGMDPWAPINGISLERYAELSAEVSETQDPEKQVEIVTKLGVQRADWDAAKAGWTARMQDMSLMGQVATRFMPMYQTALAKKTGSPPRVSFEDYVALSGLVPVLGLAGMLQHYKLTQNQWTMIAGHWNQVIPTDPRYMQFGMLCEQEAARLRAGGQPKPVSIGAAGPATSAAPATPGAMNNYGSPQPQPNMYYQQNPYAAQGQSVGAQMGSALNAFGNAFGAFMESAVGALSVGARVMVQWSDGNRYPGTVTAAQAGQVQVAFPDGRRVWVPSAYVSI
jgi:hypothetical protein